MLRRFRREFRRLSGVSIPHASSRPVFLCSDPWRQRSKLGHRLALHAQLVCQSLIAIDDSGQKGDVRLKLDSEIMRMPPYVKGAAGLGGCLHRAYDPAMAQAVESREAGMIRTQEAARCDVH